ncbi:MAG: hypothetical protein R3E31_01310 [Chloroflexota bacterium]
MFRQEIGQNNGNRPFRILALNGGHVLQEDAYWRFVLPPITKGYADAQIDDYGLYHRRRFYPWQQGVRLSLQARFSHSAGILKGTAGFGFWNAPFGDPTIRWPALPQAVWFFYASAPSDLPLALQGAGRGWFVATLDATTFSAVSLVPLAPLLLLLNQNQHLRSYIWPMIRQRLGISYAPLAVDMTAWHHYALDWQGAGCSFYVDEALIWQTPFSPRGPLGFVCWLDNQYMVAQVNGRFASGTLPLSATQYMDVRELHVTPNSPN